LQRLARWKVAAAVAQKQIIFDPIPRVDGIGDRLAEWKDSGITTIILGLRQVEAMRTVAEAVL
jgi:hypothetical protein